MYMKKLLGFMTVSFSNKLRSDKTEEKYFPLLRRFEAKLKVHALF